MKIDFVKKLTSRKFWAALIGVIMNACVIFGVPDITTEQIIALVSASSTLIAYILGEGFIDAKNVSNGDSNIDIVEDKDKKEE